MSADASTPGHIRIGEAEYLIPFPGNRPFCHFCRQHVAAVVRLTNGRPGNPLDMCQTCLAARLEGFGAIAE